MTEDQINRRWVEILLDTLSAEKPVTIGPRDASCFINALRALLAAHPGQSEPIDMLLFCPKCGVQHVDAPEPFTPTGRCECAGPDECEVCESNRAAFEESWQNPPHRSHLCRACGTIWRPADVPTNGVATIQTRGKADTWDGKPQPRAEVMEDRVTQIGIVIKDVIELLMLWNGRASAGLDVQALAGLRDELVEITARTGASS